MKTASTRKPSLPTDYLKAYMSPAKKAKLRRMSKTKGQPMYRLIQDALKEQLGI